MRAKAIAGTLLMGLTFALPAPAWGGAVTRHVHEHGYVISQFHLHGSNGFGIQVVDFAGRGALVSAINLSGEGIQSVAYTTTGLASIDPARGGFDIRVGRFGHFRGHLVVSSRKTEMPERGCNGRPTVVEHGVFVGSFRFRGERGYTQARTSRARGSITKRAPQVCVVSVPRRHPGRERSRHGRGTKRPPGEYKLIAGDLGGTYFEAERRDEKQIDEEFTSFSASISRKVGRLDIEHSGSFLSPETDSPSPFRVPNLDAPLTEAVLTPPPPFSGSATFSSDGSRSGTWTGDLAVTLPGLPSTPLTGAGIEAGLCAGRAGCTKTLPSYLQPQLEAPPGTVIAVGVKKRR